MPGTAAAPEFGLAPRRRWTLRARLIALVVSVAALALIAVDVLLPLNLRSSLIADHDKTLASAIQSLPRNAFNVLSLDQLNQDNPLRGEIGWTLISSSGTAKVAVPPAGDQSANPMVGPNPPTNSPITVGDASDADRQYRILAVGVTTGSPGGPANGYLVAWSPLSDVSSTVRGVIFLELLVTGALLILLGSVASLVIRRALKPLESMAVAADDIAAGDLQRRVPALDPGTEVGRLGSAFNGMLDGISGLLAERTQAEDRLRQFVADASHELRTPVAAVQGYTDLYRAGALPDEAAVDRAMERMGSEARRMGALVEDLLTLIQADTEHGTVWDPVDLTDLLAAVVDDARVIDPTRSWLLAKGLPPVTVLGDRLRLHQLFANLLANARTHTPPGTTVTVSVLPGAEDIAISVSDNGPGVSDADIGKLFDRFYRVDPSRSRERGGTGLGLSIVAAIVRSHQGQVLATHTPGGGLTMTVVLPRAVGTAAVPHSDGVVDGRAWPAGADSDPENGIAGQGPSIDETPGVRFDETKMKALGTKSET